MRRLSALILFSAWLAATASAEKSLVAPFSNHSKDPGLDWIGESISETVREVLSASAGPVVRREDRVDAALRLSLKPAAQLTLASVVKLAEATEAPLLVYGHFELIPPEAVTTPQGNPQSKGSLRITARVFDRVTVRQRAEFLEAGPVEDLAVLQNQVAWQVLHSLRPSPSEDRQQFLQQRPVVKISALEPYIRGLMSSNAGLRHRFFTQAARLDPTFPHPCYYLGKLHFEKDNYREAAAWLAKVGKAEGFHLEAGFLLGLSRYEIGDFEGARAAFEAFAATLDVPEVHNNLGAVLLRLERLPDALALFRKALEAASSDPDYHFNLGYALWKQGQFEVAADRFRAVLDREQEDPDAVLLLGRCLKRAGPRRGDARTEGLERLKEGWE